MAVLERHRVNGYNSKKTTYERACQTELILTKLQDKAKFGQSGKKNVEGRPHTINRVLRENKTILDLLQSAHVRSSSNTGSCVTIDTNKKCGDFTINKDHGKYYNPGIDSKPS